MVAETERLTAQMQEQVAENQRKANEEVAHAIRSMTGVAGELPVLNLNTPMDPDLALYLTPEATAQTKVVVLLAQCLRVLNKIAGVTAPSEAPALNVGGVS